MTVLPSLLLILACLSGSFGFKDLQNKVLVFPSATKKAIVQANVSLHDPLTNFTVCLRFFPLQVRPFTLFFYATKPSGKGFQIVRHNPTQFNLQIGGTTQIVTVQPPSHSEWQHICAAWNSTTGVVHFWHNGKPLPRFVLRKGYELGRNGTVFLGHDRDSWGKKECFVGEMADVNMWPRVLKPDEIHLVLKNDEVPNPLVSWRALNYTFWGDIRVEEALYPVS